MNNWKTWLVSALVAVAVFAVGNQFTKVDVDQIAKDAAKLVDVPETLKGEKGDRGFTGVTGKDGVDGKDGAKGDKGDQGVKGDKGDKGDAAPVTISYNTVATFTDQNNKTKNLNGLSDATYKFSFTKTSSGDMTVALYEDDGVTLVKLFTTVGGHSTTSFEQTLESGDYKIKVEAEGSWTVKVEKKLFSL